MKNTPQGTLLPVSIRGLRQSNRYNARADLNISHSDELEPEVKTAGL
jgi:hypothetical protein